MTDQQQVEAEIVCDQKQTVDQVECTSETESGDLEGSSHDEEEWDLMLHATLSSVLDDGSIPVSIIQSSIKAMSMSTSVPASFSEDYNDTFALDDYEDEIDTNTHTTGYAACNCDACLGISPYDYSDLHAGEYYAQGHSGWSHRPSKGYGHPHSGYGGSGYYKKPYNKYVQGPYKHYVGNNYRKPRSYNSYMPGRNYMYGY